MRYSTEPRFRKYVKGYGLDKYSKKLGKQEIDDATKAASKRVV